MIHKNLQKLISNYNEFGIYFLFNEHLWWFNGKRIEKWCSMDSSLIFSIKNNIYTKNECTLYYLKNKKFELSPQSLETIYKTSSYINPSRVYLDDDNNFYNYSHAFFCKNGRSLPNKVYDQHGFKLLHYNGFLFFFTSDVYGINEKFNLKTSEWSIFKHHNYKTGLQDVSLLNGLFYILFNNGQIGTYNSKVDSWQLLDIRFHC